MTQNMPKFSVTTQNTDRKKLPKHYWFWTQTIPVRNPDQQCTYQVQEILSEVHHPHVEQGQQTCSVSELKTNTVVSIFPGVLQQLYSQVFFPLSSTCLFRYVKWGYHIFMIKCCTIKHYMKRGRLVTKRLWKLNMRMPRTHFQNHCIVNINDHYFLFV